MALDKAWLKAHWYYIVGGVVGLIVLYELIQALSSSGQTSSSTGDLSGGGVASQNLQAASDITSAQYNAQIATAAYGAGVQNNQIAASLQLGEVQTAAELEATNNQTSAGEAVGLAQANAPVQETALNDRAAVQMEQLSTNAQVAQTQIEGTTIEALGADQASVENNQINTVGSQIQQILQHSKHASQDLTAFAPIVAEETGQGGSAGALAGANAQSRVAGSAVESTAIQSGASLLKSTISMIGTGLMA